jgi:PAS domain S-box-containing protein
MGATRESGSRAGRGLAARGRESAAAVLDFAVTELLRDDTTLGALPEVLARLAALADARAALAFQPSVGHPPAVLAMHPGGAFDAALLAKIGALTLAPRDATAGDVLLAYSVPVDGRCLCALALTGGAASWTEEVRSTAHAIAAAVANQIRHANNPVRLAERQALYTGLIEESPNAILAVDAAGRLVEFNAAAERLSGYRREDALGQPFWELLMPEQDRSLFLDSIQAESSKPSSPMRVRLRRADGAERTVEMTPVQVAVNSGRVLTGFLRDITEIERSHAALADQTERLNCLIDAAIPGILIADEQGLVTHVSRSFGGMFGIEGPERLVGTPTASVVRRLRPLFADPGAFTRRITETVRAREPMTGEQIKAADGRTIECDYWPVLVDGRYRGDLWLAWDMSDRATLAEQRQSALDAEHSARQLAEQAQRQLTEQNERLQAQDEARNQFLSVVSHELRTPLTSIVSFSELLRGEGEGLTPDGLNFLDIIERNANRLHRLIGDLFMLNRLEIGALPLDLAEVDVPRLAADAVRNAASDAARQDVTVEVTAGIPGSGPPVNGDENRLLQVLDNLLSNAIKFSHRGGEVRVTATCQDGSWRIDVADSGIGIPPGEASYLFSRFVRGSNARSAEVPGTGLGLSIVKVIVEMHEGRVEVTSILDKGSTFSIYLPVAS